MIKTKLYRSATGTYAVTGNKVRYRSVGANTTWIDSLFTKDELTRRADTKNLKGPLVVNNFKELRHA